MQRVTAATMVLLACSLIVRSYAVEEGNDETPHIQKLRVALQQKCAELPRVEVNTQKERVSFKTIDLSKTRIDVEGKKYCAFRFTTPRQPGDLIWAYKGFPGLMLWYIVPAKGRMFGFESYEPYPLKEDVPNLGKRGDVFIFQTLAERSLKPDTEYIIWFEVMDEADAQLLFSLNVFPSRSRSTYADVFPMVYKKRTP